MHIVTAGVHDAIVDRRVGKIGSLLSDGKSVYVGAHHHAIARSSTHETRDDTGDGWTRANLITELNEPVGDDLSGAIFVECQLGVGVEIVTDVNHWVFDVV